LWRDEDFERESGIAAESLERELLESPSPFSRGVLDRRNGERSLAESTADLLIPPEWLGLSACLSEEEEDGRSRSRSLFISSLNLLASGGPDLLSCSER